MKKPPDCTCAFPMLVARNMCGHSTDCPSYARWVREVRGIAEQASPAPAQQPPAGSLAEDRGTKVWIFSQSADGGREPVLRFEPFPGADGIHEISIPVGWSFRPDPAEGICLVSTFGSSCNAEIALAQARSRIQGFKLRKYEPIPVRG